MPNYIKLGNLRIEIPEPANNGGGGGGGGSSSLLTGLLAFYNFSDNADASGNGVSLTNDNGVTFSAGKIGNAANFNGGNRLYSNYQILPASVSFWIKTNSFGGFKNMFAMTADNDTKAIYLVQGLSDGKLRFYSDNGSILTSSAQVADNQWHHIVVNATGGQISIWVDGSLDATAAGNVGSYGSISKFGWGAYPHGGDFLTGQLDAGGFWNRALTSAEVTELYNAGAGKEHPFA